MESTSNDSFSSSISPVSSPSSIVYVDLYCKRRQLAKVQVLDREIALLQEEIKSLAELELASRCCKELHEYVEATPDPLITLNQIHGRSRNFWKNLRKKIGWMLRCCCCCGYCKMKVCSPCCPSAKDCCCSVCCNPSCPKCSVCCCNPCTSGCPEISCHCSCNPSCPKCSVCCCCCCCKPCSCF